MLLEKNDCDLFTQISCDDLSRLHGGGEGIDVTLTGLYTTGTCGCYLDASDID